MTSRDALYQSYTAHPSHPHDARSADLDRVYQAHLRGWLPRDHELPILDLGCGDGYLLGFLSRLGYQSLVGVDATAAQAERARAVAPGAEVLLGDGSELLRERPGRFAAILCIDVLEHLTREELVGTVRLAAVALLPGGSLIARVPNADSPFHDAIRYGDLTHEIGLAPPAVVHLLKMAGLEEIEFREEAPVVRGWRSALRAGAWAMLRQLVRAWNLIETGSAGSGVYTRVAYVRARRPGGRLAGAYSDTEK